MSLLDRFKRHKEEPAPDLPSTPVPKAPMPGADPFNPTQPKDYGNPFDPAPQDPMQRQAPRPESLSMDSPKFGPSAQPGPHKDMEVIQLKLDAIRNTLEAISLRLERLEKAAGIDHR